MSRTVKQWKKELRATFEMEGGRDFSVEPTHGTHLYASAEFVLPDGLGLHPIGLVCSLSPSDLRAGHKVRSLLRRAMRERIDEVIKSRRRAAA